MKKPVRICVKCKDPLRNQRFSHQSSKEMKTPWGGMSHWCDGPQKTPGAKSYGSRSPIHYRDFAGPGTTVCGLQGGVTRGVRARNQTADVPWSRIKVDLTQTTCPSCLLVIIQRCKKELQKLALAQPQLRQLVREARGRVILTALKEMVHS